MTQRERMPSWRRPLHFCKFARLVTKRLEHVRRGFSGWIVTVGVAVLSFGCSQPSEPKQSAPGADTVVAVVNGTSITQGELDATIRAQLDGLDRSRYEL